MSIANGRFFPAIHASRLLLDRTRASIFRHALVAPLALSVACSVFLIERRYGLMNNGFLSTAVLSDWQVPIFLAATAVLDLAVISSVDALWTVACRALGAGTRRRATGAVALLGLFVMAVNTVQYNVLTYLGDWMHLRAALHTARGMGNTMPFFQQWLLANGLTLAVVLATAAFAATVVARLGRKVPDRRPVPVRWPLVRSAWLLLAAIGIEVVICHAPGVPSGAIATSLRRTSLQRLLESGLAAVTDWDGDGLGWIDSPADFAPFDPARSPFAVDLPGDGIDADGIGGDLPSLVSLDRDPSLAKVVSRPDILVVVPCSLRADALSGGPNFGPGVMPNLARLGREGLVVDRAYSHCGHTISALQQVLTGQYARHTTSLVRDMKAAGYRVGIISTQDESFGATEDVTHMPEADLFVDAKTEPLARVTSYSTSSSIMLPSRWAIRKADEFLTASASTQPVFLFVHLESCHYPYFHDSPEDLVPHPPLALRDFTPENRGALVALYRNAAANLDRRLAELHDLVNARRGRANVVSIIMADHGESLFDEGLLGHGTAINEAQMRVPCVIVNGWGKVPVPFGHTDIRPLILSMLGSVRPTRSIVDRMLFTNGIGRPPIPSRPSIELHEAERPLFMWVGSLKTPHQLGLIDRGSRAVVDFGLGTCTETGTVRALEDAAPGSHSLRAIQCWESLRVEKR